MNYRYVAGKVEEEEITNNRTYADAVQVREYGWYCSWPCCLGVLTGRQCDLSMYLCRIRYEVDIL